MFNYLEFEAIGQLVVLEGKVFFYYLCTNTFDV